jgi:alanyl-tRNA synthetase
VDEAGFNAAMDRQKSKARAAGKFKMDRALEYNGPDNEFVGYEHSRAQAVVLALYVGSQPTASLQAGQAGIVVLDKTPFYAESGGQVGDQGVITGEESKSLFQVSDTTKIKASVYAHHGSLSQGTLKVGEKVEAAIDQSLRGATMRHQSVTHLMHKALRDVLGEHVQQKGSLVNAERTRFDFTHNAPLTESQIKEVEIRVNRQILLNEQTQARIMNMEAAKQTGAMMLFGEKYTDEVRVLDIGFSRELCGGTHVKRTGDIGLFKVVSEGGVASGVRRVEAIAGEQVLTHMHHLEQTLEHAAQALKTPVAEVQAKIHQLLEHSKAMERELEILKSKLASAQGQDLLSLAVSVGEVKVLSAELTGADAKILRDTLDQLRVKLKSCVLVLASKERGKVQLAAAVSADLMTKVRAGELVNFVAQQVGGKGGGKPDMAMAGGTQPEHLEAALKSVEAQVRMLLA